METVHQLIGESTDVMRQLSAALEQGCGLKEVEERLAQYLNRLGSLMLQEVVERMAEPTRENRLWVAGAEAAFEQVRPLRFRNRFGGVTVRPRRCYRYRQRKGGYAPLDEKLGIDNCRGFSPLLSYLQVLFGASRPFGEAAELLSAALGFPVSPTAVQAHTESAGEALDDEPYRRLPAALQDTPCAQLVVQMDSTTSPQIQPQEGVSGRESLKAPTEYKMAHVGTLQRRDAEGKPLVEWVVARYGRMEAFGLHLGRAALALGVEKARRLVFLSDGLAANWQICQDHFPGALPILDFYHASEHLAAFCSLYADRASGQARYAQWRRMLWEGQILQVLAECKADTKTITDADAGWKEINYFDHNRERMAYDRYRSEGLPCGSGKVEGSCKFVVNKRFKGSGMRWKATDNRQVLRARLAKLNGYLEDHYRPTPRPYTFSRPETQVA